MKIYTKVVIDIETGEVLESEGFDYDGEIALCCMGGDAPKPSAEERALQQQQLDILEQQQEDAALMRPFQLSGMGLIEDAPTGELRYMTEEEKLAGMSDIEREQYEITQLGQERQRKAYAGELPISPALEQSLKDEEAKLVEALSRQLGPDFMSTTSGQQAMMRFTQKADLVREEARRGEISGGGANVFQGLSYMGGTAATRTATAAGFPGSRTSGMSGQYGGILDRMSNERMMQYQASSQRQAGFMGGMGQLAGAGIQAYGTYAGLAALGPAGAAGAAGGLAAAGSTPMYYQYGR